MAGLAYHAGKTRFKCHPVSLRNSFKNPVLCKRIAKNDAKWKNYAKVKEILLELSSVWGETAD